MLLQIYDFISNYDEMVSPNTYTHTSQQPGNLHPYTQCFGQVRKGTESSTGNLRQSLPDVPSPSHHSDHPRLPHTLPSPPPSTLLVLQQCRGGPTATSSQQNKCPHLNSASAAIKGFYLPLRSNLKGNPGFKPPAINKQLFIFLPAR